MVSSRSTRADISLESLLTPDVREHVIAPELEGLGLDTEGYRLLVNPTGRFEIGGPMGDAGLTGRKIIVDTYGGYARHGGGAFSGKDPSKVDRSAAYAMRWVAKNVVAAGLAERCEVQVAYAIGKAHPVSLFVETFGTENVPVERIEKAIGEVFDLRPAAIIRDLDLLRPIYQQTAAYGHFGRELPDFTWERTDRAADLKSAAGALGCARRLSFLLAAFSSLACNTGTRRSRGLTGSAAERGPSFVFRCRSRQPAGSSFPVPGRASPGPDRCRAARQSCTAARARAAPCPALAMLPASVRRPGCAAAPPARAPRSPAASWSRREVRPWLGRDRLRRGSTRA